MKNFMSTEGDTLYLKLYNYLREKIEKGELKNKLPAIRTTSKEFAISIATVVKAYELLEKNNYVESKKGSGFYITYHKKHTFYPEDYMQNEDFKFGYFDNQCEIDFSSASPKTDLFPIENLKNAIIDILNSEGEKALLYENPQGNVKFRNTIKKQARKTGIKTSIKNIQIISGAQQGINIISRILIQKGDIIVTEEPTYKGAVESFKENDGKVYSVELNEDGLDIDKLEQFLKHNSIKLLYIIPIFQNPTGISLSEEKAKKLINLANTHNFFILEDDSSSDLYFHKKINPIKSYDIYDKVIYIKSYSKIFMPGFRLGFMILPDCITDSVVRAKYSSDISTSGLNQRIFHYLIENKIWNNYLDNLRDEFFRKQTYMYEKLKEIPTINFKKPLGGLSFWISLPMDITGEAVYFKLLKEGVSIAPGIVFSPNFTSYIRVSFAQCSYEDINIGIEKLKIAVSELITLQKM